MDVCHGLVGRTVRMPNYQGAGGYRVWYISAHCLGGCGEEGFYKLVPLDVDPQHNTLEVLVPCVMFDLHPLIEVVTGDWYRSKRKQQGEGCDD